MTDTPTQQTTPEPEPPVPLEGSLIADIAAIRAAVAEAGGLGWKSLDQFQKEMREDD